MASRTVLHNIPGPNLNVVLHSPGGLAESCPPLGTPAEISAWASAQHQYDCPAILSFSAGSLSVASGVLRASFHCPCAGAPVADRHSLDYSLPLLLRRHRVWTDDRPQGRAVRLPRLRPHGASRRARLQVHLPPLLEAVPKNALD
jgi:hypothetical protein